MKKSTSVLAAVVLGSLLAAGATTVSMAGDVAGHRIAGGHRIGNVLRCNNGSYDRGFGGFSGAPGHPFMGPGIGGKDWDEHWDDDPFWTPEPYYPQYDNTAYVEPARHVHSAGSSARHGGPVRHCS